MQTAQLSHTSSSQSSSSEISSGSEHSHANPRTSEYPKGSPLVLTLKDKEILKEKYLKDFQSENGDLRRQVIGNAVRELSMLRPQGSRPRKGNATKVCTLYSNMLV